MQPSNRVEIRRGHSSPSLHLRRKSRSVLIRTKVEKAGVVWGGGSRNGKAWRPDGIKILYTCRANFPGCVGCHPSSGPCALSSLGSFAVYCPENCRSPFYKVDTDASGIWRVNVKCVSSLVFSVLLSFIARAVIPSEDQFCISGNIGNVKTHFWLWELCA